MMHLFDSLLVQLGIPLVYAEMVNKAVLVAIAIVVCFFADFSGKTVFLALISKISKQTTTVWDDILVEEKVFDKLAHLFPATVLYFAIQLIFIDEESGNVLALLAQRVILAYMIGMVLLVLNSFLSAVNQIYRTYEISKSRPIKGYLQIVKVFVTIIGFILIVTTILNKSAFGLLSGIGALSAVIMLVFKDSILGLVAAVQLSGNDMVRIGDWITVPAYGADGDVVDIKLQTVTVQNFDKTIVSVPIYSLVSSSFKNWRGMQASGGRRIKRHLAIDMNSVSFCTDKQIVRFKDVDVLKEHIDSRLKDIETYNATMHTNTAVPVNGRRLTNLGVFRAYIIGYLKANPMIHDTMTFLVRQLQPTDKGIPLEIYVFSRDQVWANYEGIQADIFDHLIASVPFFDLAVYQSPSSLDIRESLGEIRKSKSSSM